MTFAEAKAQGYKVTEVRFSRKGYYVSRRVNMDNQPVLTAGGSRKGQLYVEAPSFEGTAYSYRYYITKED